jgi:hypothetical protein
LSRTRNDAARRLGWPNTDPLFAHMTKLEDVPPHFQREVEHFFSTYKQLEGVTIEPLGWGDAHRGHGGSVRVGRPLPHRDRGIAALTRRAAKRHGRLTTSPSARVASAAIIESAL